MNLTVKYGLTRAEVWRWYVHLWRNTLPLKVIQLSIFVMFYIAAQSWLPSYGIYGASQVVVASTVGLAAVLVGVVIPQLRFKSEERTLRIGAAGISVTLGNRFYDIAWTKIARITPTSEAVYIVEANWNTLIVPDRAFSSPAQREEFIALATRLMNEFRPGQDR